MKTIVSLLLTLLVCLALPAWSTSPMASLRVQVDDAETIKEFKKYFKKYKETVERVEAVLALDEVESPAVVPILTKLIKDKEAPVRDTAVAVLSSFKTQPPVDAMLAQLAEETDSEMCTGMLDALTRGGYQHDGAAVLPCLENKDWPVRRSAVKALGGLKKPEFAEPIAALAGDKEPGVRGVVLDVLAAQKAKEVVPLAQTALADEFWQVRASAISALGLVRDVTSIPLLISTMEAEEGRLIDDLTLALDRLTARGLIRDPKVWRSFWDSYGNVYKMPTDEEVAAMIAKREANRAKYSPTEKGTSYHGVETPSRSILFVIDVSGSMEDEVVEKERFKDGNYPSYSRIDITKTELARTIEGLESYVKFNILSFATQVKPWKKGLVPANVINKSSAASWIQSLEPIGGNSKQELAELGFTATASLDQGKTNTWAALATAMSLPLDPSTVRTKDDDYKIDVDTIFFLSDGRPTTGYYVKTEGDPERAAQGQRAAQGGDPHHRDRGVRQGLP
ncbi:MAG: HEAT repeat domain-containing protein [Planctomycetota bacterium]